MWQVGHCTLQVFDVGESRSMPMELTQDEADLSLWGNFVLAAGLADAASRTVTAPIDRLKTLLQVSLCRSLSLTKEFLVSDKLD